MTSTVACLLFLIAHDPDAIIVGVDPFLNSRADQLVALAARFAIPAIHPFRSLRSSAALRVMGQTPAADIGGAGEYTEMILKDTKRADLPVQQSTTFDFVINLKTATALGLTVPPSLLATRRGDRASNHFLQRKLTAQARTASGHSRPKWVACAMSGLPC
jgi:ABC-type uncharacterized transport system substrate-binding protein